MRPLADGAVLLAFVLSAVLAGGNAVGIRFSNRELDPLWGAGLRFALAAVALLALMPLLRLGLPRGRALSGALLYGALNFAGAFALACHWAASRAAYLFVVVPVVTVALSAWLDDEPVGAELLLGGLLVLAGVYLGALRRA